MDITKIHKSQYNPRSMSGDTKKALKKSIQAFDDISGITVNEKTGNIVSGNHRWAELNQLHGSDNLDLSHIKDEYYSLDAKSKPTGFLVRIVNWTISKEKAANIAANSDLISGEFTADLQDILTDISCELDDDLFSDLRLDEMKIDFDYDDDLDLSPERDEKIIAEASKPDNDSDGQVTDEIALVKISIPIELKDTVKGDLLEFLSKKEYYNKITII